MTSSPSPEHNILSRRPLLLAVGLLALVLGVFFCRSFVPGLVIFSNDSPLGNAVAQMSRLPAAFIGFWQDANVLGNNGGAVVPSVTSLLSVLTGPVGFAKTYAPFAIFVAGISAAYAFRRLGFAPMACILGGLAAALISDFFSTACWGVAGQVICFGMFFLALGCLAQSESRGRWLRVALAGLAVGLGVIEGADIGALFSLTIASYVVFQTWTAEGTAVKRLGQGFLKLALVTGFAAFIAAQTITALVGTQIKGIVGTGQDTQTKAEHWGWATQWSLPKQEALSLVVPGLFGYRMDTPEGGNYWGLVGSDPSWDNYLASDKEGQPPMGFARFIGGGFYLGVPVFLIALWAAFQSFRRKDSVFNLPQRKLIWFWSAVVVVSLLLGFGRFAPFYQFLYALPYFSTIRNPIKFFHILSFAVLILFGYGVDGLWRTYMQGAATSTLGLGDRVKAWWRRAGQFDRRWVIGCAIALGASLVGWMLYSSSRQSLEHYLQTVQFDETTAQVIAGFSIRQVGWFVLFFVLGAGFLLLTFSGSFSGPRAKWGGVLLGLLVVADLGRADLPWVKYWNYQEKYATNPIVEKLRQQPYEHRVALLPFRAPSQFALLDQLYRIEWAQHHFLFYNIQSLDIIQMSRMPADLAAFEKAVQFDGSSNTVSRVTRRWELTNTRYLLGAAGFLELLNEQLDPVQHRFRIAERFDIVPKPNVVQARQLEDLTAVLKPDGPYALFEFTGALPRVKLYANWQVTTNDQAVLAQLGSESFSPTQKVFVSDGPRLPSPAPEASARSAGTVEFASYAPKHLVLKAQAQTPAVLLLNDRFDPNWKVFVDGKPETLLRCNYIMRGVYLTPGTHQVEFKFQPPIKMLYVSLAAIGVGVLLCGLLLVQNTAKREEPNDLERVQP